MLLIPLKTSRKLPTFKAQEITHVVTLLSEHEGAREIGSAALQAQMEWIWAALGSAAPPTKPECMAKLNEAFITIERVLEQHGKAFVHCSAGIHRTGMFTHALLLHLGYSPSEALALLTALRPLTAAGVGEERLKRGLQFQRTAQPVEARA
jgi:protein-tyrosine phosphatase